MAQFPEDVKLTRDALALLGHVASAEHLGQTFLTTNTLYHEVVLALQRHVVDGVVGVSVKGLSVVAIVPRTRFLLRTVLLPEKSILTGRDQSYHHPLAINEIVYVCVLFDQYCWRHCSCTRRVFYTKAHCKGGRQPATFGLRELSHSWPKP